MRERERSGKYGGWNKMAGFPSLITSFLTRSEWVGDSHALVNVTRESCKKRKGRGREDKTRQIQSPTGYALSLEDEQKEQTQQEQQKRWNDTREQVKYTEKVKQYTEMGKWWPATYTEKGGIIYWGGWLDIRWWRMLWLVGGSGGHVQQNGLGGSWERNCCKTLLVAQGPREKEEDRVIMFIMFYFSMCILFLIIG